VVLVVEDEPVLRAANGRALRALGDVEVFEASTVGEALAIVDASRPSVVVSDIDLPDRSGIELIGELAARQLHVPVLFVTAYHKAYKAQIPRHGRVEVLEKPVPMEKLRGHVRRLLGTTPTREAASPFGVSDYLQIACLGRHTVRIEVDSDESSGEVLIVQGEPWHAGDQAGVGFEAFVRLSFAKGAAVTCHALHGAPGERSLGGSWEMLLLEAARIHDERAAGTSPAPVSLVPDDFGESGSAPALQQPAADPFDAIWDEAIEALLTKNYPRALELFLRARELRPNDPKVAANLKRLADLGFAAPGKAE
jgi:CheY-like chemotaxis protein